MDKERERAVERESVVGTMHWIRGKTLGQGGFGFVSMATTHSGATHLPPVIAVKSATDSNSTSLSKEKELLDKFQACPFVLRCFGDEFTTENGQRLYNILLEYASGGSLADRLQSGKGLPEHVVSRCTKSLLTALAHIHRLGYVHCDIKPHNVLFLDGGFDSLRLADFGSCKARAEVEEENGFRGTVLYAAPESIARQEYLPESDVWALGCTVLQMLTGKSSPWKIGKGATAKDVLLMIGCGREIPEIPRGRKVTEEAKDFLRKCLVKDPNRRWTAEKLLEHPFVKTAAAGKGNCRRHFSLHSLIPHCFHDPKFSMVVHPC